MWPGRSSIAMSLCACLPLMQACSTAPVTPPMVRLPANLLVEPPFLPAFPRNADGSLSGGQCIAGAIDLYQAAGALRLQIMGLIEAERARQAK